MVFDSRKVHPHQELGSHSQCKSEEALRQRRQVHNLFVQIILNAFNFIFKTVTYRCVVHWKLSVFGQFVPSVSKQTEHAPGALPHHDQRRQRDSRCSGYCWNNQLAREWQWEYTDKYMLDYYLLVQHGHVAQANNNFGLCVTDVYGCLAVLQCCLKANTQVEEEVVQAILATVMEWRNSKEDWFLFGR